jgi:hypothetical protein
LSKKMFVPCPVLPVCMHTRHNAIRIR